VAHVSKAEKLLSQMRANPRDWRIESLEVVARRYGMVVRKTGGSHVVFMHPGSDIAVTVPSGRPIKPVYIGQFLAMLDDAGAV
jgi:predicted RNA binding protein YcfA (HicA-like mRNA interferase family)